MLVTKPAYFDRFACLAGDCPDTCCGAWQVIIDEKSLALYRSVGGGLGEKIRGALLAEAGETRFAMERGRCRLLTPEGLCTIQKELGEQALCRSCAFYPRFLTEIGARRELGLSLSCPEAARMILTAQECFSLCSEQTDEPITAIHELSPELLLTLRALRGHALDLARDRTLPFGERCARILALCVPVDRARRTDGALAAALETGLAQSRAPLSRGECAKLFEALHAAAGELEFLQPERKARLSASLDDCAPGGWTQYCPSLPQLWEQLLCYGIYKYFPRAAFDRSIWPTCVFCVTLPLLLRQLLHTAGTGDRETVLRLAWTLSRELEHSEDNMRFLFRRFRGKAFRPERLIGVFYALRE